MNLNSVRSLTLYVFSSPVNKYKNRHTLKYPNVIFCLIVLSCQSVVKVLSPDDGQLSIVQAAQQLCKAVEQKEKTSKDIDVTLLDSLLRGELTEHLSAEPNTV